MPCLRFTKSQKKPRPKERKDRVSGAHPKPHSGVPEKKGVFQSFLRERWLTKTPRLVAQRQIFCFKSAIPNCLLTMTSSKPHGINSRRIWEIDFYPVWVLGRVVFSLYGCQTPAQHWIKILHPWVQKLNPVLVSIIVNPRLP